MGLIISSVSFAQAVKKAPEETPSAATNSNSTKPTIKFVTEVHDFGNITEGTQATHEFKFTNAGKEPLILTNVSASCGCTTPSWPKEPIAKGKTGEIKAVYNSQGRPGPFTKTITVTSNADSPVKVITIKGNVIPAPVAPAAPSTVSPMMSN